MARHDSARRWSREALLNDVINREREKFWRRAAREAGFGDGPLDKEERALALATMMNGLPVEMMKASDGDLIPKWDRDRHERLFNAMTGVVDGVLRPHEPDIVGEYFVLDLLTRQPDSAEELVSFAWHNSSSKFAIAPFVDRCAQDFPEHSALRKTFDIRPESAPARTAWAMLAVNLMNHLGASNIDAAKARYRELKALAANHPGEPELRLWQAKAAFNLIHDLRASGVDAAKALYQELKALAANHPGEPELRLCQAKAAFNLIHDLRASDVDAAKALYQELKALAANHPGEPELRLEQAKAAVNLIYHLGASDIDAAKALYRELKGLAANHPGEPELQEPLSRARRLLDGD